MVSGSRQRAKSWLILWVIPFLLCACSKKQTIREDPPREAVVEALVFLSAVQGNPVCMVVDINKRRSSGLFTSPKTKWRSNAWLISPGHSTYLGSKKGTAKQGTLAPVSSTKKDGLLFTTDKDEFLYYLPKEAAKILLLSEPLFADRVRSGQDEEIRYGRMPAKLICNNRTVEGNLFYERWSWIDAPPQGRKGALAGLEPGGRIFAVWGPGGEFLYLEKKGGGQEGRAQFAVMQDRRGRWQETYQIRWTEPECAFSASPCPEASEEGFRLLIPAWDVEGSLQRLDSVQIPKEAIGEEGETTEGETTEGETTEGETTEDATTEGEGPLEGEPPPPSTQDVFWTSLREISQAKGQSNVDFCLLKGSIWVEKNQRAVYGVGLLAREP